MLVPGERQRASQWEPEKERERERPGGPMASGEFAVVKTDAEWKAQLEPARYRVLRKKATEPAGAGAPSRSFL